MLDDDCVDRVRRVERSRNFAIHQRGIGEARPVPHHLLIECITHALDEPAFELQLDQQRVDRAPDVGGGPGLDHPRLPCRLVDLDINDERGGAEDADARKRQTHRHSAFGVGGRLLEHQRLGSNYRPADRPMGARGDGAEGQIGVRADDSDAACQQPGNMRGDGQAVAAPLAGGGGAAARGLDGVETFGQAIRGDLRADEPRLAFAQDVAASDLERVQAEPPGDLVDLLFAGEGDLRVAEAAESAEPQLVGVDEPPVVPDMGNAIGA